MDNKRKLALKKSKSGKKISSRFSINKKNTVKSVRSLRKSSSAKINSEELKLPPINSSAKIPLIQVILNSDRSNNDNQATKKRYAFSGELNKPVNLIEKTDPTTSTISAKIEHVTELVPKNVVVDHSMNDNIQFSPNSEIYSNTLLNEVQSYFVKSENPDNEANFQLNLVKKAAMSVMDQQESDKERVSMGVVLQENNGVIVSLVKGPFAKRFLKLHHVLLKMNYLNFDSLKSRIYETGNNKEIKTYLKIAKTCRAQVLMEASLRLIGRTYTEISSTEKVVLESELNRYYTTYPLPGEEVLLEELIDKTGEYERRMPLRIIDDQGVVKIDINDTFHIDPCDFLTLYLRKMMSYVKHKSGLKINSVAVAVPSTYGVLQRSAFRACFAKGFKCKNLSILTRPCSAVISLLNKRDGMASLLPTSFLDLRKVNRKSMKSDKGSMQSYKVVFDITEESIDASVIEIDNKTDFKIISSVSSSSFGLQELDMRILDYILNQRNQWLKRHRVPIDKDQSVEAANAYRDLIPIIKSDSINQAGVNVDLSVDSVSTTSIIQLYIDKNLLIHKICRDIYDWSSAHIQKALLNANINDSDIDEVVLIGSRDKMPGFSDYLKIAYPLTDISFIDDENLSVGPALFAELSRRQFLTAGECLCRSIGIGLYTGVITFLLFRNTPLPCTGGCVYSTKSDDQPSIILDLYEGERPHVRYCRYIGEVSVVNLPRGEAGSVKCEIILNVNNEGVLEVVAKDMKSGMTYETSLNSKPAYFINGFVNNQIELDPIEAERNKKQDYDLVFDLERLDEYLDQLSTSYENNTHANLIIEKICDSKVWIYDNRHFLDSKICYDIQEAITTFLTKLIHSVPIALNVKNKFYSSNEDEDDYSLSDVGSSCDEIDNLLGQESFVFLKSLESIHSKTKQISSRNGATSSNQKITRSLINTSKLNKPTSTTQISLIQNSNTRTLPKKLNSRLDEKKLSKNLLGNQEQSEPFSTKTTRFRPSIDYSIRHNLPISRHSQKSSRFDISEKKKVKSRKTSGQSVEVLPPWRGGIKTSDNKINVSISSLNRNMKNKSNLSLNENENRIDYNMKKEIDNNKGNDLSYSRIELIPQNTLLSTNFTDSRGVKHSTARNGTMMPLNRLEWSALQRKATEVNGMIKNNEVSDEENGESATNDLKNLRMNENDDDYNSNTSELVKAKLADDEIGEKMEKNHQNPLILFNSEEDISQNNITDTESLSHNYSIKHKDQIDNSKSPESELDHLHEDVSSDDRESFKVLVYDNQSLNSRMYHLENEKRTDNLECYEKNFIECDYEEKDSKKSVEVSAELNELNQISSYHEERKNKDPNNTIRNPKSQLSNLDEQESSDNQKQINYTQRFSRTQSNYSIDSVRDNKSVDELGFVVDQKSALSFQNLYEERSKLKKSLSIKSLEADLKVEKNDFDESIEHFGDKGLSQTHTSLKSNKEARLTSSRKPFKLDKLVSFVSLNEKRQTLSNEDRTCYTAASENVDGMLDYSSKTHFRPENEDRVGLSAMDRNKTYESDWTYERTDLAMETTHFAFNSKSKSDLKAIKDRKNEILRNFLKTEESDALIKNDILTFISDNRV